jgi:hypothetical protein
MLRLGASSSNSPYFNGTFAISELDDVEAKSAFLWLLMRV